MWEIDPHDLHRPLLGRLGKSPDQSDIGFGADAPDMEEGNAVVPGRQEGIEE